MMKTLLGRLAFMLLGALGALVLVGALGLGPSRYTLYRNGYLRLDRWTGAVTYTSRLVEPNRLADCQRDAAGWRSDAQYWQQEAQRRAVNPFRERIRARAQEGDSTRLERLRAALQAREQRAQ